MSSTIADNNSAAENETPKMSKEEPIIDVDALAPGVRVVPAQPMVGAPESGKIQVSPANVSVPPALESPVHEEPPADAVVRTTSPTSVRSDRHRPQSGGQESSTENSGCTTFLRRLFCIGEHRLFKGSPQVPVKGVRGRPNKPKRQ